MSFERPFEFTKENVDTYLKAVAKEYRRRVGKNMPAELILVGGASVLINYGFRQATTDIDAVIEAASSMKDAVNCVRDQYGLPNGWLNADFQRTESFSPKLAEFEISQLKFLYPLKTLVFPAFSPPRFGPFPSFFPLREEMRETFFRPSLQPYPAALRKFAWPLWWRGRKCSSWYLHQNVPAAPAHPWVLPREREGWSYMYASTDGSENHPYPRSSFGSIGIRC